MRTDFLKRAVLIRLVKKFVKSRTTKEIVALKRTLNECLSIVEEELSRRIGDE